MDGTRRCEACLAGGDCCRSREAWIVRVGKDYNRRSEAWLVGRKWGCRCEARLGLLSQDCIGRRGAWLASRDWKRRGKVSLLRNRKPVLQPVAGSRISTLAMSGLGQDCYPPLLTVCPSG